MLGVVFQWGPIPATAAETTQDEKPATTQASPPLAATASSKATLTAAQSTYANVKALLYITENPNAAESTTYELTKYHVKPGTVLAGAVIDRITLLIEARQIGIQTADYADYLSKTYSTPTLATAPAAPAPDQLKPTPASATDAVPQIISWSQATATKNVPFSYHLTATNSPTGYVIDAKNLPSWLSVTSDVGTVTTKTTKPLFGSASTEVTIDSTKPIPFVVIGGTPTKTTPVNLDIIASNANGKAPDKKLTIIVQTTPSAPHRFVYGQYTPDLTIQNMGPADSGTYTLLYAANGEPQTVIGKVAITVDSGGSKTPQNPIKVTLDTGPVYVQPGSTVQLQGPEAYTPPATTSSSSPEPSSSSTAQGSDITYEWQKDNADISAPTRNPFEKAGSTAVLSSAGVSIGSKLNLVTAQLFVGQIQTWDHFPNIVLTSSIPTSKPNPATDTSYSDVEALTVDGGPLNLYWSPFAGLYGIPPGVAPDIQLQAYGDRGNAGDRHYFFENDTTEEQYYRDIASGQIRVYIRDGLGIKMVDREGTTTTNNVGTNITSSSTVTSNSSTSYGFGGSAYFGAGIDGGFLGAGSPTFGGLLRVEGLVSTTWLDHSSVSPMYPAVIDPKDYFLSAGGSFSFVYGNTINIGLLYMAPIGVEGRYAKKVLLGTISIKR